MEQLFYGGIAFSHLKHTNTCTVPFILFCDSVVYNKTWKKFVARLWPGQWQSSAVSMGSLWIQTWICNGGHVIDVLLKFFKILKQKNTAMKQRTILPWNKHKQNITVYVYYEWTINFNNRY